MLQEGIYLGKVIPAYGEAINTYRLFVRSFSFNKTQLLTFYEIFVSNITRENNGFRFFGLFNPPKAMTCDMVFLQDNKGNGIRGHFFNADVHMSAGDTLNLSVALDLSENITIRTPEQLVRLYTEQNENFNFNIKDAQEKGLI